MSTRAAIIVKSGDKYQGIYCHYDGYISGVGQTLQDHYQDYDKVKRLIALGFISLLGERVEPIGPHDFHEKEEGTTVAYMRDRGEDGCEPVEGDHILEVANRIDHSGYIYIFEEGSWTVNGIPLAKAISSGLD